MEVGAEGSGESPTTIGPATPGWPECRWPAIGVPLRSWTDTTKLSVLVVSSRVHMAVPPAPAGTPVGVGTSCAESSVVTRNSTSANAGDTRLVATTIARKLLDTLIAMLP